MRWRIWRGPAGRSSRASNSLQGEADEDRGEPRARAALPSLAAPGHPLQHLLAVAHREQPAAVVSCTFSSLLSAIIFTVNGAATQTINMPNGFLDANGERQTGWIPMNIRFTSSIRVQIQQGSGATSQLNCDVSWALD